MKKKLLAATLAALSLTFAPFASGGAIETVSLAGGGGAWQGPGAIAQAMAAVSDGGEVRVIQAGTYNPIAPPSAKKYTVRASVPGVVIEGVAAAAVTIAPTTGPLTVTLDNLRMIRSSGAGIVFDVQLTDTQATSLSVLNSKIDFTDAAVAAASNCLQINTLGTLPTAASNLTFYNTQMNMLNTNGQVNMGCIGVGGLGNAANVNVQNLTVNLTSSTMLSNANTVFFTAGGNNQTWNISKSRFKSTYGVGGTLRPRGISFRGTQSNNTYNLTDTIIEAYGETLGTQTAGDCQNIHWVLNRCTLDNRRFGQTPFSGTNANVRFVYSNTIANNNLFEAYDTLFLTQTNQQSILGAANNTLKIAYCTIIPETAGGANAISGGTVDTVANTIIANYLSATTPATTTVGNLVVGTADADAGGDAILVADLATLALDADFVPTATSPAKDAANPNAAYLTLINNLDRRALVRTSLPDIGAMEFGAGPQIPPPNSVNHWVMFE